MGKMWARGRRTSRADGGKTAPRQPVRRGEDQAHRHRGALWATETSKTTLTVYAHLINTDDDAGNMAAIGAIATPPKVEADDVVALRR